MKRFMALTLSILMLIALVACGRQSESPSATETPQESPNDVPRIETMKPQSTGESSAEIESNGDDSSMTSITITAGSSVFSAKLDDNDTTTAFLAQLPMTLNMSELNGNEKYYYLPDGLPTDSIRVGGINAGDLMLYGSECLVLFYGNFTATYSYTKLGYIEDVSGLADALGQGSVEVAFTISE